MLISEKAEKKRDSLIDKLSKANTEILKEYKGLHQSSKEVNSQVMKIVSDMKETIDKMENQFKSTQ